MRTSLVDLMILNESHLVITGASGTGKTSLVKSLLASYRRDDFNIVVFDYYGTYREYCDYHAPYPLNVFEHVVDVNRLCDILNDVLQVKFRQVKYTTSPLMEELLLRVVKRALGKGYTNIREVIKELTLMLSEELSSRDELLSGLALKRRLRYIDHWIFYKTHSLILRLLRGELQGCVIGIDLSRLNDFQRLFYTLSLVDCACRASRSRIIFVIDEAHIILRRGLTTFIENLRVSRNFDKLFILITHSIRDIPEELQDIIKIVVEFPTLRDQRTHVRSVHTATVRMLLTSRTLVNVYGKTIVENLVLHVCKPTSRRIGKDLLSCVQDVAKKRNVSMSVLLELIERYGIPENTSCASFRELLQEVWTCLDVV